MAEAAPKSARITSENADKRERVFDTFRRWGYLAARLDPLGFLPSAASADVDDSTPWSSEARALYCGTIGAEFMHIADSPRRAWIADRLENPTAKPDAHRILERLIRAELFEQTLQARFVGTKRYS